ncbi:MAG: MATE family efflux transporter [Bacillota bacterium]|nr:MATE family efflux transporter [Bacillota bacterium]
MENNNINMKKVTIKLALPSIMEMFLQTLLGIADTAMVGAIGGFAIAAISITDNPIMLMIAVFAALSVGTTALVARFIGAKNYKDAENTILQSLFLSGIMALVFTSFGLLFSKNIVSLMGAEPEIFPYAVKYMRIVLLGLPGLIITFIMSGALRGSGDTRTPMIVNGISNILNIIGNYFLIFESRIVTLPFLDDSIQIFMPGAGLGVTGAAIATTTGRYIATFLILRILFNSKGKYNLDFEDFKIDKDIIKRIFKIGLPAAGEQLLFRSAQLAFFRIVASLGTVMIAAHKITITAESISFMQGWGFALAATTLVGQYLGAEDKGNAKRGGYTAGCMAVALMSVLGVLFFFFPEIFISIFTDDPEISHYAVICLRIVAVAQPFLAIAMVFAGALRGAGDTKTVLITTGLTSWIIRVGLGYFLAITLGYGLVGAWVAMILDFGIRGIAFVIIFKKGNWQNIQV